MNEGLNGEGKEIIKNVEKTESNMTDNLIAFYNNEELVKNNKATSVLSEKATLEQKENSTIKKLNEVEGPTTNESNPIYDFVKNLKTNFLIFIKPKGEYSKKVEAAQNVTLLMLVIATCEFIFLPTKQILSIMLVLLPVALLIATYFSLKSNNKKANLFGILSSITMILTFKLLNIIFGIIYLIGNIFLLANKKTH